MKPVQDCLAALQAPRKIIITHHYNPDADALGSSLALQMFLQQQGHHCTVISPNEIPDFIMWLPNAVDVVIFEKDKVAAHELIQNADIVFCLDFNHFSRTKSMEPSLLAFAGIRVMIDHHLFPNTESFDYGVSLPEKSSTCEMIYDFILMQNGSKAISLEIATCLYAGTLTDTGSFKFSSTSAAVHRMVAELMDKGLVPAPIHQAIFDNYNENRLRFLGYVLAEKMEILPECHAAIIAISKNELYKFNINSGDSEGIVNYPLSIKNIIFSIFMTEKDGEIRMSFRSKGNFNVNEFARTYFNGGGHANAAGGKSDNSLSDTIQLLKTAIVKQSKSLQSCYELL